MRIAPLVSLGLSIVIGMVAVFFGRDFLNGEADAGANVIAPAPEAALVQQVETRKILVIGEMLERGDLLSQPALRVEDWPVEFIPDGAVSDTAALLSEDGQWPQAVGTLVPGEPVLAAKITHDAVRETLAALIEPGFRAVSISVTDASGVSGFVLPDHRVDVNFFEDTFNHATGAPVQTARTLLEDVRVLAVDQLFHNDAEGAAVARTVTLQVLPEQARALGLAVDKGRLGLALRPSGEEAQVKVPATPVTRPKRVVVRTPAKPAPSFANIRVIQGDTEETVRAPAAPGGGDK